MAARRPPNRPADRAMHDSTSEVEALQPDDAFAEPTLSMPPVRPRGGPSTDDDESAVAAAEAPTDKVSSDASTEFHETVEALVRLHLRLGRIRDGRAPWLRDEIAVLLAKLGKRV